MSVLVGGRAAGQVVRACGGERAPADRGPYVDTWRRDRGQALQQAQPCAAIGALIARRLCRWFRHSAPPGAPHAPTTVARLRFASAAAVDDCVQARPMNHEGRGVNVVLLFGEVSPSWPRVRVMARSFPLLKHLLSTIRTYTAYIALQVSPDAQGGGHVALPLGVHDCPGYELSAPKPLWCLMSRV